MILSQIQAFPMIRQFKGVVVVAACLLFSGTAGAEEYFVYSWDKGATDWRYRAEFTIDVRDIKTNELMHPTCKEQAEAYATKLLKEDPDVIKVQIRTKPSPPLPPKPRPDTTNPAERPGSSQPLDKQRPQASDAIEKANASVMERIRLGTEEISLGGKESDLKKESVRLNALREKIMQEKSNLQNLRGDERDKAEAELKRLVSSYKEGLEKYSKSLGSYKDQLDNYVRDKGKLNQGEVEADAEREKKDRAATTNLADKASGKTRDTPSLDNSTQAKPVSPKEKKTDDLGLTNTTWSQGGDRFGLRRVTFSEDNKIEGMFNVEATKKKGSWTSVGDGKIEGDFGTYGKFTGKVTSDEIEIIWRDKTFRLKKN